MSGGGLRDDWRCRFTLHVEGFKVEFDFGASRDGPIYPVGQRRWVGKGVPQQAPRLPQGPKRGPPPQPLVCPKCGQGRIIEALRGFGCSRYREGCDFVVWKEISGKRLTEK